MVSVAKYTVPKGIVTFIAQVAISGSGERFAENILALQLFISTSEFGLFGLNFTSQSYQKKKHMTVHNGADMLTKMSEVRLVVGFRTILATRTHCRIDIPKARWIEVGRRSDWAPKVLGSWP